MAPRPRETDLYPPVKALLESQGYTVKAEIGAADVVAMGEEGDDPVIVELKGTFSLSLFHQAVARQRISDSVYVAVPHNRGRRFQRALRANAALCRRLGLGLITVRLADGHVQVHLDPAPFRPRPSAKRKGQLLREFARREGDPNRGGTVRSALVTAYRQDAIRLAAHLCAQGPAKGSDVSAATGVARATRMMADNHHGWFERVGRGIYTVTPDGRKAVRMAGG
ncbi:DUF2161 domain-containing phosphodiesterase [Tropicimonas sp.]|uniref:DUF2161 domain-containing phosphodiesterase n=1 Tax=Tropicimonas sp. TaxID=2067044 RepID=UPI003A860CDF